MSAFRVYFGEGEITENESGVDLSNFRQCTLYHPNPDTLTMLEVWYWLTCTFSLDPEPIGQQHKMGVKKCDTE
uniref:Uncharacterized protein n=1 Tax=Oryza punctata TaxID=4537 RepID=A0A0E0M5M8_ORYPU